MATSSIPAAIDGLLALIKGVPQIATYKVAVSDGFPLQANDNLVAVGGTVNDTVTNSEVPANLGPNFREEDYLVEVTVTCYAGSDQQKPPRDTAFAIFGGIETALRSNFTLGGAVRYAQVVTVNFKQSDATDAAAGRTATITAFIRCQQRI